jgi:chloramphenicol 3-O-phosphotransferase
MTGSDDTRRDGPPLILITGLMAAGKSSVAQALAERLPKSVHLRGDVFRRMIVGGQAEMSVELSPEAYEQLRLRYRIAAIVAREYLDAGFTVVYQDIIIGPDLADVVGQFEGRPVHVVVLSPSPDVVAVRESERAKTGYGDLADVAAFDHVLRSETPRLGLWLDTSTMTIAQTADNILASLDLARVGNLPRSSHAGT